MEQRIVIRLAPTRATREGGGKTAEALIRHAEPALLHALAQHFPDAEVQLLPGTSPTIQLIGITPVQERQELIGELIAEALSGFQPEASA